MPKQVLLFGETDNLKRCLHFFESGVPFFGGFGLVELDERDEEFRFVFAEAQPRGNFWNALVRQIFVAVHHAADKVLCLETDPVRKYAERKGGVRLLLCVVVILQEFPVVQVFEDFFCRFLFGHALNVRKLSA